jgi:hypothetical protein
MLPKEETTNRNEKRREQKFYRQVKGRGERDPDEPASAEVHEGHSCAESSPIIAHMTSVNPVNFAACQEARHTAIMTVSVFLLLLQ